MAETVWHMTGHGELTVCGVVVPDDGQVTDDGNSVYLVDYSQAAKPRTEICRKCLRYGPR